MPPNAPKAPAPLLKNTASAPFVYCDVVPAFGIVNGVIELELAAQVLIPKPDGSVQSDLACVAHLRCSVAAANNLVDALDKALDMLKAQVAKHTN